MGRFVAIATAILFTLSAFQTSTAPKKGGNPEAAKMRNPVAASPASAAAGRRIYQRLCVRCHGSQGQGDGGAAGAVPPDLSDAQWDYGGSDGEIFAVIHDGTSTDMEGYAARITDADIWNVVNYVRTFAAKP